MKRRLAAILALDMVGYGRLMAEYEAGTVQRLKQLLSEVIGPGVRAGGGRIFKTMGDGLLAEFPSVVAAAETALVLHQRIADTDVRAEDRRSIAFRMGCTSAMSSSMAMTFSVTASTSLPGSRSWPIPDRFICQTPHTNRCTERSTRR